MTVKEFIAELEKCNQELEVFVEDWNEQYASNQKAVILNYEDSVVVTAEGVYED